MVEGNHILCCVCFSKVCQISTLLLHFVNSSHHGAVGSASTWHTQGRGFELLLNINESTTFYDRLRYIIFLHVIKPCFGPKFFNRKRKQARMCFFLLKILLMTQEK